MKVFDLGANIGYYVLMESELICNKGKILAIEPVKKNMQLLEKNLKLNNNKITALGIDIPKWKNLLVNYLNKRKKNEFIN